MIVGDPTIFALESGISRAFERSGALALGFFVIHIAGRRFGVRSPEATLLACSHGEVRDRIDRRGWHIAAFAIESASEIADAVRTAIYAPEEEGKRLFGFSQPELSEQVHSSHLLWAPDGDEAFNDSSHVVHFDAGDRVRLIGFKSREVDYRHDPATLTDIWLDADAFYGVLSRWHSQFHAEWLAAPKFPEEESNQAPEPMPPKRHGSA
jgi:hypothetical protein